MTTVATKLQKLRTLMTKNNIDFYYVPTRDDHNNEYVPKHWQRREWLTGFTGSYGEALIGHNQAFLWTDPRYYLQAEQELDEKSFQLMKQIQGVSAPVSAWLSDNAFKSIVGVDPKLISVSQRRQWANALYRVEGKLNAIPNNFIDEILDKKPAVTIEKVRILDVKYAGFSAEEKIARVRAEMYAVGAKALVISQLDEIAWLFNIRGNDVPFNPLVISYAILTEYTAILFVDLDKVSARDQSYFKEQHIEVQPYHTFASALKVLQGPVWIDPHTTSWWVELELNQSILIEKPSPILLMKSIKNETELKGAREAHRLDALAVVKFFYWLEKNWQKGVDEVSAADQLESFRRQDSRCLDLSFDTICGFADHGAIIHYRASEESKYTITDKDLLLVDSGGQYFEGTTDITRTIHLGKPTDIQKKHFTLVLKGHIALRHLLFPNGVYGEHINAVARMPLWQEGMDFGHGTGHGVGSYLCVHEGPQRISYSATGVPLKPGMIVSNEPGLYFPGKYGIRIENLCEIVEEIAATDSITEHGPFYGMRDLTLVPYARKLIDVNLLSEQERNWIDEYHREIYETLAKDLSDDEREWLKEATAEV